ncbi:anti-sigma-I factor RsgI family protein [Allofournierella massiliensis]|uniref:anti-sigma-I factor RsgI family protein n=1 Tax=Allofournierella massiliensis TaxID=1650663 RepID=UPI003568DBF3
MTRKKLTALLGAGLALSMAVCLLAGCSSPAQSTATAAAPAALSQGGVIYLKVNPEIAVRYDEQGMVTSLEGRNPDGKEILTGYTGYEGRECKAVIGELVARINEAGYFVEEVEGDNRQITLEVARGSSLPADDFLSGIVEQVQTYTAAQQLTSPVEVDGESNYGWTDYADTDYGPGNDGVTDYSATDYGPDNDGVTDYGATDYTASRSGGAATPAPATPAPGTTDYGDTDYGPNNDGVTDYNDTDYGPNNDGVTDYNDTDYGPNNDGVTDYNDTDYGPNNDGVTDYNDTDYGPNNDGVTDYNDTDYGPNNDGVTDYNDDGDSGYTAPAPAPVAPAPAPVAPAPAPAGDSGYDDGGDSGYDDGGDSGYDDGGDSGYDD